MQITDIATVRVNAERGRTWLFVEVSTDTGEIGIGEASQSRFDVGVELLVQQMKTLVAGRHPMDLIEPLRARLLHNPFSDRALYSAFSGIEQALWDLAGKAVGQPVHRLLGGAPYVARLSVWMRLIFTRRAASAWAWAEGVCLGRDSTGSKRTGRPRAGCNYERDTGRQSLVILGVRALPYCQA